MAVHENHTQKSRVNENNDTNFSASRYWKVNFPSTPQALFEITKSRKPWLGGGGSYRFPMIL